MSKSTTIQLWCAGLALALCLVPSVALAAAPNGGLADTRLVLFVLMVTLVGVFSAGQLRIEPKKQFSRVRVETKRPE